MNSTRMDSIKSAAVTNPGRLLAAVAAMLSVLCSSCGGGSSSNNLSAAQAHAISQEVVQSLVASLQSVPLANASSLKDSHPNLSTTVSDLQADSTGCTSGTSGENCNFPISFTGSCPGGGTIAVTGDISGTLSNSGSGSIDSQITVMPSNCAVSNVTFSGDPNIAINGQINFTNSGPTFPISLSEMGGISYGPHPSGSCQVNVTYSINSLSSCTVTGTVCGQSVNGTC